MANGKATTKGYLRTLIVLGRVSNLPTVWSNCLAGWWLGEGGEPGRLVLLCIGATFFYLGGMFLNDAFDAQYDLQHRPERPIPSGAIRAGLVWQWGFGWLVLGWLCFWLLGPKTALLGFVLATCILVYDALHKIFAFSPVLMAVCRLLVVLSAASIALGGITGLSIWSGLVLASYVGGLGALARQETAQGRLQHWPLALLCAPLLLALVVNRGPFAARGFVFTLILGAWIAHCLRYTFWTRQRNISLSVAGLLAGIVLVDLLAVCGGSIPLGLALVALFVSALLLQRVVPAT